MAIDVRKEVEQEGYGKCLALNNGVVEILVTIDIGPRIIHFGLIGGNNIFYQDREHPETVHTPEFEELYAGLENRQYRLYGGHRLWLSPQNRVATIILIISQSYTALHRMALALLRPFSSTIKFRYP